MPKLKVIKVIKGLTIKALFYIINLNIRYCHRLLEQQYGSIVDSL